MHADYDSAVKVESVDTEYRYVAEQRCDGCGGRLAQDGQALFQQGPRSFDVLHTVCNDCGTERDFTFDITSFFSSSIFDWGDRQG